MDNKLKISLEDLRALPEQKIHLQFNQPLPGVGMVKPVLAHISLHSTTTAVKLSGRIQTIVQLQCHTCLNQFFQSLDLALDEEFVYEDYLNVEALSLRERELQKHDFFETVPYYGTIDVSDVISQAIVLAMPNYCSCGPQCAGPPIYKGSANKHTENDKSKSGQTDSENWEDPRWHKLKTILPNNKKRTK